MLSPGQEPDSEELTLNFQVLMEEVTQGAIETKKRFSTDSTLDQLKEASDLALDLYIPLGKLRLFAEDLRTVNLFGNKTQANKFSAKCGTARQAVNRITLKFGTEPNESNMVEFKRETEEDVKKLVDSVELLYSFITC